jgi:hypothetical protein
MKKLWSLLALVLTFVILIGSYFYIKNKPAKVTTPDEPAKVTTEQLLKLDKDKISKMVLTSKASELIIEKKNNQWVATGTSAKLNQNTVDGIASSFVELTSDKLIEENSSDLTKYGLKEPSVTAKVVLQGGEEKIVYLGNKTPTATGYYLMVKDINKVYTVEARYGTNFSYKLEELRDKTITSSIDLTKLNYFKVTPSQGKVVEVKANEQGKEGQEYGMNIYSLVQPYKQQFSVDSNKFGEITKVIPEIAATDVVEDNAKDLAKYGLDKPKLEVLATDTDKKSFHIFIGKDASDTLTYFKLADSNIVYTTDKEKLKSFNVDPVAIISRFTSLVNIDDVDKFEIQSKDKKYEVTLSRKLLKKAEKEGDKDEYETTYKINGKDVKEEDFKKYYQVVIGLLFDAESEKTVPENPEVTTTFYLNKGDNKQVVVKYVPYDNNFYAVYKNGVSEFVISKDKLNAMLSASEQLAK